MFFVISFSIRANACLYLKFDMNLYAQWITRVYVCSMGQIQSKWLWKGAHFSPILHVSHKTPEHTKVFLYSKEGKQNKKGKTFKQ